MDHHVILQLLCRLSFVPALGARYRRMRCCHVRFKSLPRLRFMPADPAAVCLRVMFCRFGLFCVHLSQVHVEGCVRRGFVSAYATSHRIDFFRVDQDHVLVKIL